jgi:phosphoglycolate phosphatase
MEARLILFDIDGTLVNTAGAGRLAMERAFRKVLGISDLSGAEGVSYAGRTDPVILDAIVQALEIDGAIFNSRRDRLVARFVEELRLEMMIGIPARRTLPGVRALLQELASREEITLGLVTGNLESTARIKLEPFGINHYFATGGFASDHADRRRIAAIGRDRAAAQAGIDFAPSQVTIVGDTQHDVDCARANGFRAVAVDTGWVPREALVKAAPDSLLSALDDSSVLEALGLCQGNL